MKTANEKASDTKSFDDDLGDDFLTSWKPSKMKLDAGLDLDEGVNGKAGRKKFTLSKLDMDFDFDDGGLGKLADFDVDLSGLDIPSSPEKKSTSGKKAVEKLVERKHKSEDVDKDFDFNEFKSFSMDDLFLDKKTNASNRKTLDLADIETNPSSRKHLSQKNVLRTTSITFSDDLFHATISTEGEQEFKLKKLEKSSEVESKVTRLPAKITISDIAGKHPDNTETVADQKSQETTSPVKDWIEEKVDLPAFDESAAKMTAKHHNSQLGPSPSREVSSIAFKEESNELEASCASDSPMGISKAQKDTIASATQQPAASSFNADEGCVFASADHSKVPPQMSATSDNSDATILEKPVKLVETDEQQVQITVKNRTTSSLNQESQEMENLTRKASQECLLSMEENMQQKSPSDFPKAEENSFVNVNPFRHDAASLKRPDEAALQEKTIQGTLPEIISTEKDTECGKQLAEESIPLKTRSQQRTANDSSDVVPKVSEELLHGKTAATTRAENIPIREKSSGSTIQLESPSSASAVRPISSSVNGLLKKTEQKVKLENIAEKRLEGSATSITGVTTKAKVDIPRQHLAIAKIANCSHQILSSARASNMEQSKLLKTKIASKIDAGNSPSKLQSIKTSPAKISSNKGIPLNSLKIDRFKTGNESSEGLKKLQTENSPTVKSPAAAALRASIDQEKNYSVVGLRTASSLSLFQARSDANLASRTPLSPTPPQKRKPVQERMGTVSASKKVLGASSLARNKTDGVMRVTSSQAFKFEEGNSLKCKPDDEYFSAQHVKEQEQPAQILSTTLEEVSHHDQGAQVSSIEKKRVIRQSISEDTTQTYDDILMEDNDIIESADRFTKEIEDMCKLLKKKHEEAKDLFVRALVTNNLLLMLCNPMQEDKIKGITKSINTLLCHELQPHDMMEE